MSSWRVEGRKASTPACMMWQHRFRVAYTLHCATLRSALHSRAMVLVAASLVRVSTTLRCVGSKLPPPQKYNRRPERCLGKLPHSCAALWLSISSEALLMLRPTMRTVVIAESFKCNLGLTFSRLNQL